MLSLLHHIRVSWAPCTGKLLARRSMRCFIPCTVLTSVGLVVQKTKKASAKISVMRKYESSEVSYGLYNSELEIGLTLSS